MNTWSLACTACGKCCNSAPQLSVPELLHHERRFIGCLALRRIRRTPDGTADARALDSRLLHPFLGSHDALLIATRAFDGAVSGRCPALNDDGSCDVNSDRKPALCSAVPLEPLVEDSDQARVLAARARDAAFFGAACLIGGSHARSLPLVRAGQPTALARDALERRRRDLELDKRFWGDAVFRTLPAELFGSGRVPADGLLTLSIVPVLVVLARISVACRERCLIYLGHQAMLLRSTLDRLPAGADIAERQLLGFGRSADRLIQVLQRDVRPAGSASASAEIAAVESWLGIA